MSGLPYSTIAMTCYNWLAAHAAGPRSVAEIALEVGRRDPTVTMREVGRAMRELERRGLVSRRDAFFDVRDPDRRVVIARDRSDDGAAGDPADFRMKAGWKGWLVAPHPRLKAVPIERAAAGGR